MKREEASGRTNKEARLLPDFPHLIKNSPSLPSTAAASLQAPPTGAHERARKPRPRPSERPMVARGPERDRSEREGEGEGESIILPLGGKKRARRRRMRACTMPTEEREGGDLQSYQPEVGRLLFQRLEILDLFLFAKVVL